MSPIKIIKLLVYYLFLLTAMVFSNSYFDITSNTNWPTLSIQIFIAALFAIVCVGAYLYRMHGVKKKNRQLFDLNTRLILEVNERKKAEKNLFTSNQRFVQLSQATFEAIFITDQNKIEEVNQSAIDMFGYSRNELIGMPINQLLSPVHKKVMIDIFVGSTKSYRATGIKKNNTSFFIELRGKNIDYDNKKVKVFAISDITEKVNADKQKEVLEQQLRQAQKMEAVGNLAGGVAHDFNNMLQVILGFSEMAAKKLTKEDSTSSDVAQIISTTEKAAHLTKKLITLNRKQTYQPRVVNLNAIITNLENILVGLLGKDFIIQKNLQYKIPTIYADPGQIEQVLINLILNARDAINEKKNGATKKIEIITRKIAVGGKVLSQYIDITLVDHICIEIKDNGCGIPEEIQQRIYEPFFTTKPEGKGTGLGLSTVYGIIKQNNAIIDLESEVNIGTSFKIYWPSSNGVVTEQKTEKVTPHKASGNETILLVEDEDGIRNFAVVSLQQNGYKVYAAENGKKALKLIEEKKIEFDLLVTDLNMPDMDGDELVNELNEKKDNLKAIIISGYSDEFISKNGFLNGNFNFLQKPFSIKNLLKEVRATLDRN